MIKVFISWSGDKSRRVAVALREWLPFVINSVEPFVSSKDIYAGTRWQMEIAQQLEASNFGIVCVTRDNQFAPWLNFEAGALAKAVESSRVIPLAIDLKPSDVELPIGQFQSQPATQEGLLEVVGSINASCQTSLDVALLERAAEKWWPDLETQLSEIDQEFAAPGQESGGGTPARSQRELIEETLNTVRSLARATTEAPMAMPVEQGHPVVEELRELATAWHPDTRVIHSKRRRALGIRGPERLPPDLRADLVARAALYGVEIDFLSPSSSVARRAREARAQRTLQELVGGAEEAPPAGAAPTE